ncbi:MAG TPA: hypothetical protein VFS00_15950, partial [Polyangiaceae bacterium]|nr:hypothetical protein [Polyangiaceae bacterium]
MLTGEAPFDSAEARALLDALEGLAEAVGAAFDRDAARAALGDAAAGEGGFERARHAAGAAGLALYEVRAPVEAATADVAPYAPLLAAPAGHGRGESGWVVVNGR